MLVIVAPLCTASAPGLGARAVGMGGAYTAVADDGSAAYWNPAGISQVKVGLALNGGLEGGIKQLDALKERDPEVLDGTMGVKGGASLVLGNLGLNAFTHRQATLEPGMVPKTMRTTQTDQLALTLATEVTDLFAFGMNAKYVMVNTAEYTSAVRTTAADGNGFAVDLGAMFKVGKLVRLGVVLKDYGLAEIKLNGAGYEWPTKLVLGGAVKVPMFGTVVAADLETPLRGDREPVFHVGVEQPFLGILALRAGGYQGTEGFNFTAGCGLKLGPAKLDVAADLGTDEPTIYATAEFMF